MTQMPRCRSDFSRPSYDSRHPITHVGVPFTDLLYPGAVALPPALLFTVTVQSTRAASTQTFTPGGDGERGSEGCLAGETC